MLKDRGGRLDTAVPDAATEAEFVGMVSESGGRLDATSSEG